MKKFLSIAIALAGCAVVLPAYALTADGLTYTLTAFATPNPDVDNFTLTISGINGSSDKEGGRYGVFALAFNEPAGFVSATPPPGFVSDPASGLSSGTSGGGGCSGHGNFFCFQVLKPSDITQSLLAANSTLTFDFTVDAAGISTWGTGANPDDFKISWDGTQSKHYGTSDFKSGYDHVSENLPPTPAKAPEIDPASASAALTFLAGGMAILRGRRRKS